MSESSPPPSSKRFIPTPVETTVKKSRRFAPEPVETTARSSRKDDVQKVEDAAIDRQDFAPAKRRFVPEPVETTFKSSKLQAGNPLPTPEPTPVSIPESPPPTETPKPRRRFTPELIETSKRSKKAGDQRPATLPTDKTDLTPGIPNIYTCPKRKAYRLPVSPVPNPPDNTPASSSVNIQIPPLPPRRQGSMRPHLNTRRSTRQDSFRPELEAIPSEESKENSDEEESSSGHSTPSLSGSFGSSEDSIMRLQLARTRESCDDRFSGYLLSLAAKAAEKQLREQALAAFPNETFHEIVEHFYDREVEQASDDDSVEGIGLLMDDHKIHNLRRKSTEVGWAAKEMQEHQEKLNRLREEETNKKIAAEAIKPTFKDPFWTNGMTVKNAASARAHGQEPQQVDEKKEAELDRMRSAASPPMLGADLKFRMCPSPKQTKFESDQRHDIQPNRSEDGGGLWGGYCVRDEPEQVISPRAKEPALIQTPQSEREDPFSSALASQTPGGAKSPKTNGLHESGGIKMLAGIDERLKAEVAKAKAEEAILEEFSDTFVTQVYNYLSLGYPSLARQYDEELARISRVAPDDLRMDDKKQNAKGHIGLVDAPGTGTPGCTGEQPKCARWKALRIYILEWGRQHPSMSNGVSSPSAWGVRARRGSWAI